MTVKTTDHTPGPWEIQRIQGDPNIYIGKIDSPLSHATVHVWNGRAEESDARLIAAAPDLARALRQILANATDYRDGQATCCTLDLEAAERALKKAGL